MQMLKPIVGLYLDVRRMLNNGRYPLKLRVTFNVNGKQVQKYYKTGYSLSKGDWEKFNSGSVPFGLRKMRAAVIKLEDRANGLIEDNSKISPSTFEALFVGRYALGPSISALFNEQINGMEEEGRISTASSYRCAMKSLMLYQGDFPLEVVDPDFLQEYEVWMLTKGEKITTVGFYLRALRAVYNIAIDRRIVNKSLYPFGRHGYTIKKGSNFKKALKRPDKVKLERLKVKNVYERKALAYWLFSYYCNGMNFTDMAYLKPSDIHADVITFVRRKTMRTVKEVKPLIVPLRKEAKKILAEYGMHTPYCFGIITDEHTPEEKYRKIQDWVKTTNKFFNKITKRLGMPRINTYSARHTFASMLLTSNKVNVKAIQQSLGHRSLSTTESYLADLDIEEAKKISKLL